MRRVQLFELHEQPWFPRSVRDDLTDALQFGLNLFRAYTPITPLLQRALERTQSRCVVDLCSGSGGPWLGLTRKLQKNDQPLQIWITDKYPHLRVPPRGGAASENRIRFYPDSVDAMRVPRELKGFRTMFTAFHHFCPEEARAILQDAVDAGQGIGIFEITRRAPAAMALMLPWALLPLMFTPWIRPFRWSRLFWTYGVPVIPVVLLFDGVVSCLRTYRPRELREIIGEVDGTEYQWEVGEQAGAFGRLPITYAIGWPVASESSRSRLEPENQRAETSSAPASEGARRRAASS